MRILLVEPYHGGSHRAWAEGYRDHSAHRVSLVTHEAQFWKWRMHGAHVTLADRIAEVVDEIGPPDVLVASSMVNLPALLGAARRSLGTCPVVLFMHENQLTYPWAPRDRIDTTYAMINWTSMTVADRIVFNSSFHRSAWFDAVPRLLGSMPDRRHLDHVPEVEVRSVVLPVGIDLARFDLAACADGADDPAAESDREPPIVLWNHRADHDKGPDEFVAAMEKAAGQGLEFRVALAGERLDDGPEEFERLRLSMPERIIHDGHASEVDYLDLLRRSRIVVSTARQEFFGIAITEAIYAGGFPILPHRLVYPERIPAPFHERCLYVDGTDLVAKLRWALTEPEAAAAVTRQLRPEMWATDWSTVAPRYDALIEDVVTG